MPVVASKAEELAWLERISRAQSIVKAAINVVDEIDVEGYDSRGGDTYCEVCRSYNTEQKVWPNGNTYTVRVHAPNCAWKLFVDACDSYKEVDPAGNYLTDEGASWVDEPTD